MNLPARDSVSIKLVIGLLLFAGSCVAAALYADDRYAKSQDLKKFISMSRQDSNSAADLLRKQMLEDRAFELDLVPDANKTDVQRALANRNKAQLQDVQNRISKANSNSESQQ